MRRSPLLWSELEDATLREVKNRMGKVPWRVIADAVAEILPKGLARSADQCCQRWTRVLAPHLTRQEWTAAEDALLLDRVELVGISKWRKVADALRTRSDIQCRHRYLHLKGQGAIPSRQRAARQRARKRQRTRKSRGSAEDAHGEDDDDAAAADTAPAEPRRTSRRHAARAALTRIQEAMGPGAAQEEPGSDGEDEYAEPEGMDTSVDDSADAGMADADDGPTAAEAATAGAAGAAITAEMATGAGDCQARVQVEATEPETLHRHHTILPALPPSPTLEFLAEVAFQTRCRSISAETSPRAVTERQEAGERGSEDTRMSVSFLVS